MYFAFERDEASLPFWTTYYNQFCPGEILVLLVELSLLISFMNGITQVALSAVREDSVISYFKGAARYQDLL